MPCMIRAQRPRVVEALKVLQFCHVTGGVTVHAKTGPITFDVLTNPDPTAVLQGIIKAILFFTQAQG